MCRTKIRRNRDRDIERQLINRWNRAEGSEINSYVNGQLNFDKSPKTIQSERMIFVTNGVGIIEYSHVNMIKLKPFLLSYKKMNSKWIIDLSIKAKTVKI